MLALACKLSKMMMVPRGGAVACLLGTIEDEAKGFIEDGA
jgi:hypothetical protein